ncbi:MAG: hypothetical protein PWQ87_114 [Candidatus Woesearchaeota archaeon]|nr:hypothetical protein [Candidatus Woesearchaeota archaeon]
MKLPKRDMLLLCQLRNNSREPLTKMSKQTRIPVSTLYDRLKHFEENKLIERHTSIINFAAFGYKVRVNIMLKVSSSQRDALKKYLQNHENVNNLYKINNGFDFLFEAVFKSIEEAEEFIDNLEEQFEFKRMDVHYITSDIKREGFLSSKELISLL